MWEGQNFVRDGIMKECVTLPLAPLPSPLVRGQDYEANDRVCLPFLKNAGNIGLGMLGHELG